MMQLLIASRRGAGGTGEEGFEGLYDCMGSNTTAVDRAISRKVRYLRKTWTQRNQKTQYQG